MLSKDILFRCSGLGHIMGKEGLTEKQAQTLADLLKKESRTVKQNEYVQELIEKRDCKDLGEGVITHLVDVFVSAHYGRREEIFGKYLTKGKNREEDSITLYSLATKNFFKKNDKRLSNGFITGEVDIFLGDSIEQSEETFDTKTSWGMNSFLRAKFKPLDRIYYWQGMGYMALTGAKKHMRSVRHNGEWVT